jgi:hypothetical protein
MARRNDREELFAAWRALAGISEVQGWRTIPVSNGGACRLFAGRHFPGNEEALIVAFSKDCLPSTDTLPQGRGFQVMRANIEGTTPCIALCREPSGRPDLFAMMATDIADTLREAERDNSERTLQAFLTRIRAWQDFMRRNNDGVLSPDSESGLFAELAFLKELVAAGLSAAVAVDAWQGPMNGLQDFTLGTGAIEVKSTLSDSGFPAIITSLEQLDDSLTRPLFLAGLRLVQTNTGRTLPDIIQELRSVITEGDSSLSTFTMRLLSAGYFEQVSDRYTRRFSIADARLLTISNSFPRLTCGNVAFAVRHATYELDLDLISEESISVEAALNALGWR